MGATRRSFIRLSATVTAMLTAVGRRMGAQGRAAPAARGTPPISATRLAPLGAAVLPAELGEARITKTVAAFAAWIAGYREGEEILHPYGSERLTTTGPSPAARWTAQLDALDAEAQRAHGKTFGALAVAERQALVRAALAAVTVNARVPAVAAAPHVALGLLAHFLDSNDATNLAYGKVIDAKTCRPIGDSPKMPVALQRAGRA